MTTPPMTPPRVVVATGHMVDRPDRAVPRFPAEEVARVTAEVRAALAAWQVGPDSTVLSGGARGADLIVADEAQARGARIVLCLALPPEEFIQRSVEVPGTDWVTRFRRIARRAEVRVLGGVDGHADDDVFARANDWMIDLARSIDPGPHAIVVWDGRPGDGSGGTADMVERLRVQPADPRVRVIDPLRPRLRGRADDAVPPGGQDPSAQGERAPGLDPA